MKIEKQNEMEQNKELNSFASTSTEVKLGVGGGAELINGTVGGQ